METLIHRNIETKKIRLALFSSGLGQINRGFEISTARFYKAIGKNENLDVKLYSGGYYPDSIRIRNICRNKWLPLMKVLKPFSSNEDIWTWSYALEQTSYCFGLIAESFKTWQPEIVWTKEVPLAHVLYEFRRIFNTKYKIIFANGGGFRPKTYAQFDFIQQLQNESYEEALAYGIPAQKMSTIPNIVKFQPSPYAKEILRQKYAYGKDDWIVICIAAWNSHHKRIDYLINEIAKIKDHKVKLLLCGQPEPDSHYLRNLASEKLGERVKWFTVSEEEVSELLGLADIFVLCSLYEGLGAVLIEAALSGLPVLSHPHGGAKFILENEYWFCDMKEENSLSNRLIEFKNEPVNIQLKNSLKETVNKKFDEQSLSKSFIDMICRVYKT